MAIKAVVIKVVLVLVLMCGSTGALLFWLADPLYLKAPQDHKLLSSFHDHQEAFGRLRQMATEDSTGYLTESHLDARLSGERKQEYRNLLSEISPGLIVTRGNQSVRFIFASGGLSAIGPGWLKGVEYLAGSADREGVILESLDQPASLETGNVYLRQIEPGWFLVFQKTD